MRHFEDGPGGLTVVVAEEHALRLKLGVWVLHSGRGHSSLEGLLVEARLAHEVASLTCLVAVLGVKGCRDQL